MSKDTKKKRASDEKTDVAYQNKDITSKFLAENLKGKTFGVYGLDLPEVEMVLPTNIPTVKANELRLDNLFLLADGTAALVDYESKYDKCDKVKFLNYITGIANRYLQDRRDCPTIRMIVIYTGDIKRRQVSAVYDVGAVKMNIETAFLSELDSREIFEQLKEKVEASQLLTDEELMEFIVLPLSYRDEGEKQEILQAAVDLAVKVRDRGQQFFVLAGIMAFADKIINREVAQKIRRAIEMTQVAQIFEEERLQAEKEKRQAEAEKRQAKAEKYQAEAALKKEQEEKRQIVINMIKKNYSVDEIVSLVSSYSRDDVELMQKEILL